MTAVFTFNLTQPTVFTLTDVNGSVPFSPARTITQPAGKSTYTFDLGAALRQGTTDQVIVATPDAGVLTVAVPVNCVTSTIGPPLTITQTWTQPNPYNVKVISKPSGLASTGNPIGAEIASALVLLLLGACLTVAARTRRGH